MNIFKRKTSQSPPSYGRSLSEPATANSEIESSLKNYPWYGPVKNKMKKNECAVFNVGKQLDAYRWQTHPSFRWKGGKRESLQNNKGDLDEAQQNILPNMIGTKTASSASEVLGASTEKLDLINTQSLRVPFTRSISEPEPHCSVRFVRPWPTSLGSVETEQQGHFIRGIFSTLSSGFSRMLSLKGQSTNEPVREGILR